MALKVCTCRSDGDIEIEEFTDLTQKQIQIKYFSHIKSEDT